MDCLLQMLDGLQTLLPSDELKKRFDQEGKKVFTCMRSQAIVCMFIFVPLKCIFAFATNVGVYDLSFANA